MNQSNNADWKQKLTPDEYHILREKGTEPPFSGSLLHNTDSGMYVCAGCGNTLFSSDTKYESGSGWPSFWQAVSSEAISLSRDQGLGMDRIEVTCGRCGGHLGHVFNDGPKPSGQRYCINSMSLKFKKQ